MNSVLAAAAARVQGIDRYVPGAGVSTPEGKLSSNEAPLGVSPAVRAMLEGVVDRLHHYDDGLEVRDQLARHLGVRPGELVLTSGSDELCFLTASLFLHGGEHTVVLSEPSYAIDVMVSRLAGARIRSVPLAGGAHDLPRLLEASQEARLLWLPTPHNPTGCAVPPDQLAEFVAAVPETCVVVIDEAYRGYVEPEWLPDTLALVRSRANVIVQRTFSKDSALAGLRVGYGLGHPQVISALELLKSPFNVNAAGLAALRGVIADSAWTRMRVDLVVREREIFTEFLSEHGVEFFPSQANFVTVRLGADHVRAAVASVGLSVRPGESLGLPGWCRITIGWPPQMALLRNVLRPLLGAGPVTGEVS